MKLALLGIAFIAIVAFASVGASEILTHNEVQTLAAKAKARKVHTLAAKAQTEDVQALSATDSESTENLQETSEEQEQPLAAKANEQQEERLTLQSWTPPRSRQALQQVEQWRTAESSDSQDQSINLSRSRKTKRKKGKKSKKTGVNKNFYKYPKFFQKYLQNYGVQGGVWRPRAGLTGVRRNKAKKASKGKKKSSKKYGKKKSSTKKYGKKNSKNYGYQPKKKDYGYEPRRKDYGYEPKKYYGKQNDRYYGKEDRYDYGKGKYDSGRREYYGDNDKYYGSSLDGYNYQYAPNIRDYQPYVYREGDSMYANDFVDPYYDSGYDTSKVPNYYNGKKDNYQSYHTIKNYNPDVYLSEPGQYPGGGYYDEGLASGAQYSANVPSGYGGDSYYPYGDDADGYGAGVYTLSGKKHKVQFKGGPGPRGPYGPSGPKHGPKPGPPGRRPGPPGPNKGKGPQQKYGNPVGYKPYQSRDSVQKSYSPNGNKGYVYGYADTFKGYFKANNGPSFQYANLDGDTYKFMPNIKEYQLNTYKENDDVYINDFVDPYHDFNKAYDTSRFPKFKGDGYDPSLPKSFFSSQNKIRNYQPELYTKEGETYEKGGYYDTNLVDSDKLTVSLPEIYRDVAADYSNNPYAYASSATPSANSIYYGKPVSKQYGQGYKSLPAYRRR